MAINTVTDLRNTDSGQTAFTVRQNPVGGSTECHAVQISLAATAGTGAGLNVVTNNSSSPAIRTRAAGPMVQLYDASNTLRFEISNTGAITSGSFSGGAISCTTLAASSNATVGGTLAVTGATTLTGALGGGAATFSSTLGVTGATTLSTVSTSGAATLASAAVTGNATVGGTLGVTGATTLTTVSTSGAATLNSASVTGNATVGGTLGVTGAVTLSSTLNITGYTTMAGGQANSDFAIFGNLSAFGSGKAYRFRTSGSSLDLEATGVDLLLSNWSGTNFDGTQRSYLRFSADAQNIQVAGKVEFADALYGSVKHTLNGAANTLGFYGAAAAAKQSVSGSRGGNAALASLLTALSTIGLITDGSSA